MRRTKCRLLTEDQAQRLTAGSELTRLARLTDEVGTSSLDLYNGACLFAVAAAYTDGRGVETDAHENTAWRLLGLSLLLGGEDAPWEHSLADVELEALPAQDRSRFADELRVRLASPFTPTPEQARRVLHEVLGPS